jgi:hypothetical protein
MASQEHLSAVSQKRLPADRGRQYRSTHLIQTVPAVTQDLRSSPWLAHLIAGESGNRLQPCPVGTMKSG